MFWVSNNISSTWHRSSCSEENLLATSCWKCSAHCESVTVVLRSCLISRNSLVEIVTLLDSLDVCGWPKHWYKYSTPHFNFVTSQTLWLELFSLTKWCHYPPEWLLLQYSSVLAIWSCTSIKLSVHDEIQTIRMSLSRLFQIVCLQEVDARHFDSVFSNSLRQFNYEGRFIKRTGLYSPSDVRSTDCHSAP